METAVFVRENLPRISANLYAAKSVEQCFQILHQVRHILSRYYFLPVPKRQIIGHFTVETLPLPIALYLLGFYFIYSEMGKLLSKSNFR
jgi:hypothetical protein